MRWGFNIIDRYIGKTVLTVIILVAIVLLAIAAIITFVDQTRHIGDGNIDFAFLMWYILLQLPQLLVMLFPIAVLIGTVVGLGMLAKNSELVIMQCSGMSKAQIILSSCKLIVPIVIVITILGQTAVPLIQQYATNEYSMAESQGRVTRTGWGIWLRDGNDFVSIRAIMSDQSLHEIKRYEFEGINLKRLVSAESAIYNTGSQQWDMFNVSFISYDDHVITKGFQEVDHWSLYLNPERMEIFNLANRDFTVFELYDYINYLESNNIDSSQYRVEFYKKMVLPLAVVVMLLLGASTVFGPLRSVPMSARVLSGMVLGFVFYMTNEVVPNFTTILGFNPWIGVLLPSAVFILLSLLLLSRHS